LNEVAAVPPNDTAVAPVKLVPLIVTVAPVHAFVGVKLVTVGIAFTWIWRLPAFALYPYASTQYWVLAVSATVGINAFVVAPEQFVDASSLQATAV